MKITESQLRKIIQTQLKEFRLPEKELSMSSDNDLGVMLDKALGGKHASGRPFPSWLNLSINENKQIIDLSEDDLLNYVDQLMSLAKRDVIDVDSFSIFYDGEKHNLESPYLEIIKSIVLFTGGNVASVRSPTKFRTQLADPLYSAGKYNIDYIPKKIDYQIAKNILLKLAAAKNDKINMPIYRGITLNFHTTNLFKPGIKFNNWPLSSWTTDKTVALEFAESGYGFSDDTKILIQIDRPRFGCYIADLSAYEAEKEVIFGKKLKIIEVVNPEEDGYMTLACKVLD
jgi:hypothetical protein